MENLRVGNDFIEQANQTKEWSDVIISAINKAMEKTNVATLAYVDEIDTSGKFGVAKVKPFPLDPGQKEYYLDAIFDKGNEIEKGDIVSVVFMDKNFRNNLESDSPKQGTTSQLHSLSYGVIIPLVAKGGNAQTLEGKTVEKNGVSGGNTNTLPTSKQVKDYVDEKSDENKDHSRLNNLDYEHSGHTGFASSEQLSTLENKVVPKNLSTISNLGQYNKDTTYMYLDNNGTPAKASMSLLINELTNEIGINIIKTKLNQEHQGTEYVGKYIHEEL